jgi:hypothetical protein
VLIACLLGFVAVITVITGLAIDWLERRYEDREAGTRRRTMPRRRVGPAPT